MFPRHLTGPLRQALADTPVVLLQGGRQVGKSTLARSLAGHGGPARYVTLDDLTVLGAARSDPAGFVAGFDGPAVIDEVQRAPDLLLAIKAAVDRDRRPGRFLLTGSANVLLLPRIAESLAGRMEILTLAPLTQGEIHGRREGFLDAAYKDPAPRLRGGPEDRDGIIARLLRGGFPEAVGRRAVRRRAAWFAAYLDTVLGRDVRELSRIEDLTALPRLAGLLAARAAGLLNLSDIARGLATPASTLKRYFALLERTFLVQSLPAWSGNLGRRLVKAPKLLFGDTGLLAHLLGVTEERVRREPGVLGPLLENFVANELRRHAGWSHTRVEAFHFRSHTGPEVDLVLEDAAGRLVGIEVKASATVEARDFSGLRVLVHERPRQFHRGMVLHLGREVVPFGERLHAVPLRALWEWGAHVVPGA